MIITTIDQPGAEAESIMERDRRAPRCMASAITQVATGRYDLTKEIKPQCDALRRRIEAIAKMNEKHDTVAIVPHPFRRRDRRHRLGPLDAAARSRSALCPASYDIRYARP